MDRRREARPQAGVGLERLLGLEADEVLERVGDRHGVTLEQEVAGQQGAVEGPRAEHRHRDDDDGAAQWLEIPEPRAVPSNEQTR